MVFEVLFRFASVMTSIQHSAIYVGGMHHRRWTPIKHAFRYQLFMMYLDLDELPTVFQSFWFWSVDKPNLASFRHADHLGGAKPLKQAVVDLVYQQKGIRLNGPIRLLTHLRYWGYGFNPVSFYYCYDASGENVEVIVAEINNTPWGEQYCYVLSESENLGLAHQKKFKFQKDFHISPLMPMDMMYDWRFDIPGDGLLVQMKSMQQEKTVFSVGLSLKKQTLTAKNMAWILIRFPLMTIKVILAIYGQALWTWLKGARFYDHPSSIKKDG